MGRSNSNQKMPSRWKQTKKYLPATVAWTLLLSTTALFFIFPAQWYIQTHRIWAPIVEAFVAVIVIANFSLATFMDPGIIPKALRGEDDNDDLRAPLYKTVDIAGYTVRMKWCVTCQFYRPPRCSHCSACDTCIESFDHHCPWVNNCIGRRNYRFFFMFLMSLSVHMIAIFSLCLIFLLQHMEQMSELRTVMAVVVMVIICILFIPIVGLSIFHIVLVSRGRTTNEQVTGKYRGGYNPFTRSCCYNCFFTLCGPQYPVLVLPEKAPSTNVTVLYQPSAGGGSLQPNSSNTTGNQVVYIDNGSHPLKPKSGNLASLHSPRSYRQMVPSGNREISEHDLGLQASQSLDCEPTPPIQRHGSKNNFFPTNIINEETPTSLSHQMRPLRSHYGHGSPHPNRQRKRNSNDICAVGSVSGLPTCSNQTDTNASSLSSEGARSRSQTPDSISSPEDHIIGTGLHSPTFQQKIRSMGGVPTPFAVPGSPVTRRSNPPTPTQPGGPDFIGFGNSSVMGANSHSRIQPISYYEQYGIPATNGEQRRFLSEGELMYERQYGSGNISGSRESDGPIRELASSPQRGVYNWKDNSPTGGILANSNFISSNPNYFHSNPTSPIQHNAIANSSSIGNSALNNRGYYHGNHSGYNPPVHSTGFMVGNNGPPPLSPNMKKKFYPGSVADGVRASPTVRRPISFVRALEMTDTIHMGSRAPNNRNSPVGTGQIPTHDGSDRTSVYDMNYEISV